MSSKITFKFLNFDTMQKKQYFSHARPSSKNKGGFGEDMILEKVPIRRLGSLDSMASTACQIKNQLFLTAAYMIKSYFSK
jgi:hypothetical protein